MSIQQSVNQAISGSLFLLNQTAAFQRMKAFRAAKKDAERDAEVDKIKNEGSDDSSKEVNMLTDMQSKLHASIAEAEQARKNSEEFRKRVLQGVYRKEDRWDGK